MYVSIYVSENNLMYVGEKYLFYVVRIIDKIVIIINIDNITIIIIIIIINPCRDYFLTLRSKHI